MRQTLGHAPSPQAGTTRRSAVARVMGILAASALLLAWLWVSLPASRADLVIVNRSACSIWIDVSKGDGTGTIDLGATPANVEWKEPGVLDRGDLWTFRFWRSGRRLGSDVRTRAQLEAEGWRYVLPQRSGLDDGCAEARPPGTTPGG